MDKFSTFHLKMNAAPQGGAAYVATSMMMAFSLIGISAVGQRVNKNHVQRSKAAIARMKTEHVSRIAEIMTANLFASGGVQLSVAQTTDGPVVRPVVSLPLEHAPNGRAPAPQPPFHSTPGQQETGNGESGPRGGGGQPTTGTYVTADNKLRLTIPDPGCVFGNLNCHKLTPENRTVEIQVKFGNPTTNSQGRTFAKASFYVVMENHPDRLIDTRTVEVSD